MKRRPPLLLVLVVTVLSSFGVVPPAPQPAQAQTGTWYVSNSGTYHYTCGSLTAPCATIQAAIDKAASGDTIKVAVGTYTGTIDSVARIEKSITLSGGWNDSFTSLIGLSALDGNNASLVMMISTGPGPQYMVVGERLVVQNGQAYGGGGIRIGQTASVVLKESVIRDNASLGAAVGGNNITNYGGTLTLINSEIAQTRSNGVGAFSVYNNGTLVLSNTTFRENTDDATSGGIDNYSGSVYLNNSTIQLVSGISIRTNGPGGVTYLSNSVLTAIGSGSSACSGTLQSSGHNIVSNILGCNFVAAAGDLQNVDPKLGPLFGTPAFFTLMPDSPAIDAGNPSGCNDHLGNPLLTDQRGSLRALDGNGDGVARCDIGAFEYDFDNPLIIRQVFLPGITRNYCANFFDDFNFQSGWPTGESEFVLAQYLNGEYRIQSKQPYLFLFRSPACERDNYVVEADMRWDGTVSSDIGLLFGLMPNFSQYYFVDIDPAYQIYALFRRNSNGSFSVIAPWTQTGAIRPGLQTNHLKVTRNGGQITLEINGVTIGSWFDSTITGPTRTGLAMAPYDDAPVADARFDNFRVTTIGAGTLGLPSLTPNHATGQPLPAEFQWHLPERELTFPQP